MEERRPAETQEERRTTRSGVLASGTLACPACDAPVSPGDRVLRPHDTLVCPFCSREGPTRAFLSLAAPARPAHVVVRLRGLSPLVERAPRTRP